MLFRSTLLYLEMKMKLHNLTIALGIIGVVAIIFSFIWNIFYRDNSQFAISAILGVIAIAFAYVYEWQKRMQESVREETSKQDEKIKEQDEKIGEQNDVFGSFDRWIREELKNLKEALEK